MRVSEREDIGIGISILIRTKVACIRNTVDVAAPLAEAGVWDEVEGEQTSHKQKDEQRGTDGQKNALANCVQFPESDVRHKHYGCNYPKEKTTWRGKRERYKITD